MFVNVCSHARIDPVCGGNLEAVSEEHLSTWGLGNLRVPLLVGRGLHSSTSQLNLSRVLTHKNALHTLNTP